MQTSHVHVRKQLERSSGQLAESISSVSGLEAQLGAAKAKYTYMQEQRAYIADLCDMLQARMAPAWVPHQNVSAQYDTPLEMPPTAACLYNM